MCFLIHDLIYVVKTTQSFRITGLDAAGPLNYVLPSFVGATHLSRRDAKFVDMIHTDKYVYGIALRTATADFYPNGGFRYQPACPHTRPNISNAEGERMILLIH